MRTVGEKNVVFSETFFGSGGRGDEENSTRAETKHEDVAIFSREFGKSSIRRWLEKVKMANNWEGREDCWWKVGWFFTKVGVEI